MLFFRALGIRAYTVHEKPSPAVMKDDRAEELVFIKDGFSLFAALAPPVWMIVNRLWLVLAGYLASVFGLIIIFGILEIADYWLNYTLLALNIIVGFESDSLMRWTLERRSWRQIAHVTGPSSEECERRFFDSWLPTIPEFRNKSSMPPSLLGSLEDSTKFPPPTDDGRATKSKRRYNLFNWRN